MTDATAPARRPDGFWLTLRDALRGAHLDYTAGSLTRAIVVLAIPMVLEMAMESLFAIADIFFVSKLGDAQVAAVGLTESLLMLVYALAIGLGMGTTALVARRIGEKDLPAAAMAAAQAVLLGIVVGGALGLPCLLAGPSLLAAMGAGPDVVAAGGDYTRIVLGTCPIVLLLFLDNAIFRGAGDPVVAMKSLALANGINLLLDPCLIFGFGPLPALGLTGAAIATATGRTIGVVYQLCALQRGRSRVRLHGALLRPKRTVLATLARISGWGIVQLLIATASWVVLMRLVAPFGKEALAGYTIAIRIQMVAWLPSWGISNAAATLVGQNLGARQPDRAERSVWLTGSYNMLFLVAVMVVLLAAAEPLVAGFTADPAVRTVAADSLRVISYGYVFYAWGMVMLQAFNGAGDTATPTWLHVVFFWLLEIPLAWLLAHPVGMGVGGVFWSIPVAESLLAMTAMAAFRRGGWKSKVV